MALALPQIKGVIRKISIFPPLYSFEIIMIHRIMIDLDKKISPTTIMNAKDEKMRLLRDVSITLASMYISKENKKEFIADYFNITENEVTNIVKEVMTTHHKTLLSWQENLKDCYSIDIAWDEKMDCELTRERVEILRKEYGFKLSDVKKYDWFTPRYLPRK